MSERPGTPPESLDPGDWTAFRAEAHAMLDDALDLVAGVRQRPVWQAVPDAVKAELAAPSPLGPTSLATVCEDARRLILPYATGNTHPRFFGWVHGAGSPSGIIAEMLAAAMNSNVGGRDHGAVYVERQVLSWCKSWFGMPDEAGGLIVSGTSMATLIGLTVARNALAGADVRRQGVAAAPQRLVAYASKEAHSSAGKAMEILGLGADALRSVPVDAGYRMDCAALARMIADDRSAGHRPFAVIATAGTVNTGSIDPIAGIADICQREGLWLHADGAFGGLCVLSDALKPRVAGIDRAHSVAFDFHKWLHVPYDAGCILVRDGALHRQVFSSRPVYLTGAERGLAAGEPWLCDFGPELSRGFRALKVWFTLREHGTDRLASLIEENCRQAAHLAMRVQEHAALELLAPVTLNIACFRYRPLGLESAALDALNASIVAELQERGIAAPSTTRIGGSLAIRVNITNHRTTAADLDLLVASVIAIGRELHG